MLSLPSFFCDVLIFFLSMCLFFWGGRVRLSFSTIPFALHQAMVNPWRICSRIMVMHNKSALSCVPNVKTLI